MAVITQTNGVLSAPAAVTLARTSLSASDSLTHDKGAGQVLVLFNTTGSVVNVNLAGTAPTTLSPDGYGGTISTSGGKAVPVPANGCVLLQLDDIWAYLSGTGAVAVTGGTGVAACLYI